ncbi:MAG: hypothetical protein HWE25_09465 [Alphaproteobacteria bacterium]|nr:hypothetical protein [Alphaproteobacteria bacterium]
MMNKNTINWRKASVEIAGIVFAVLLALWLEAWRDDMELQDRADEALERVHAEISQNRIDMIDSNKLNLRNLEALRKAMREEGSTIDTLGPYLHISSASLSDSSWTSAKMTEVLGKMPMETIGELAALYETQQYFTEYARFLMKEYTELTSDIQFGPDREKAAVKFAQHLAIMNSLGEQLVQTYDDFLKVEEAVE